MPERQQLRQLQVPTAVQRVPGMPHGPVRDLIQNTADTCHTPCIWWPSFNFKTRIFIFCQSWMISSLSFAFFFSSQLMTKEPLEKLGFKDLMDPPLRQADGDAKPWPATPPQVLFKGWFLLWIWPVNQFLVDELTTQTLQKHIKGKDCCVKLIIMASKGRQEDRVVSIVAVVQGYHQSFVYIR